MFEYLTPIAMVTYVVVRNGPEIYQKLRDAHSSNITSRFRRYFFVMSRYCICIIYTIPALYYGLEFITRHPLSA